VNNVKITHQTPHGIGDRIAYTSVQGVRFLFDLAAGFKFGKITEDKVRRRKK